MHGLDTIAKLNEPKKTKKSKKTKAA